ncbi:GlcNAc-PI de-N-acetylase [Actinopolymorpha cephalotaxi]|uniref:GlcNAc-PI de-N-acetylase n=1 Tax=Actinopolymorpha cephalotaxi TaxID=504797 RepID=A0A1I2X905_9ACTN|nr:PIG-L deacetylase family protein [Actinopolymorpha cephalotaxi]NYH86119.1 LmbE family N-acetylglucosaminyl deacetylase [Actinopolymorpha cephalotaxi]SFH09882.1 GlcNAc-PI de-N-acetylase [Actinopolymorpha cephalotaxi]
MELSGAKVLGVFAHPDDETFFAGATFAACAEAGGDVRLATLTAGEAGAIGAGPARAALDRSDRGALEAAATTGLSRYAAACTALGVRRFGVVVPGRWRDAGDAGAGSLAAGDLAELAEAIRELVADHRPDVLVTVDADGVTGHPDHVRTHEAVQRALDLLGRTGTPALMLGGCVRSDDVATARERLAGLVQGREIGTTGIVGTSAEDLVAAEWSAEAGAAKLAALDAYAPGLGTAPLAELVPDRPPVGDGVLLRTIAEVAGPSREYFRPLRP